MCAQTKGTATSRATVEPAAPAAPEAALPSGPGITVDQVIGVVNGDLVLESDLDEERRFAAFQPYRDRADAGSRDKLIERLVDRLLILQQAKLNPSDDVTLAEASAQLQMLRKDIPACKKADCETDAGWQKFVARQGFTVDELTRRWRERMEILKFIELRFRSGIDITPAEIKAYYDKTLLPQFAAQKATPPPVDSISDRIQEILLQQQVNGLLADWLKQLKAQGSVRMMRPGEVQP